MDVPAVLVAAFPPSADLLLDRVRRQTADAMLREIAAADYGIEADERMEELRPIRDTGTLPNPMPAELWEVLNLTQFAEPDEPEPPPWPPGPSGPRGHVTRLFACAVLLRAQAGLPWESADLAADTSLAQGLVSARILGDEMSEAAARFLTWRLPSLELDPVSRLLPFGLLILAVRVRRGRLDEPALGAVAEWVLRLHSHLREEVPTELAAVLLVLSEFEAKFWRPLAVELRAEIEGIRDPDVRAKLHDCALLLLDPPPGSP